MDMPGRHVHAGGVRVWIREAGPVTGPVVLLVHGLAANGAIWQKIVPSLAGRGLRVLVPDLPGHGRSDGKRHRGTYSPRFFGRVLLDLLDVLGIERACLVGNSLGGVAATRAALQDPGRIARLVLVDSAGLSPDGVPWSTRLLYAPFALPALLGVSPSPLWVRIFLQRAVVADPAHAAELAEVLGQHPPLPGALRRSAGALLGPEGRVSDALRGIGMPTLFIWGEQDVQFPLALAEAAARRTPGARLARIAGVGHVPQWEAPDAVAALVADFALEEKSAAAAGEAPPRALAAARAQRLRPSRTLRAPARPPLAGSPPRPR